MQFEPLYFKDNLCLVNKYGDVGIVTLWSPVHVIYKKLAAAGIDLAEGSSRIAVLGTLFGNGLPELLRNLLFNPQIKYLILMGKGLSNSKEELKNFFSLGLEETVYLGSPMCQIVGTQRKIDGLVTPDHFKNRLTLVDLTSESTHTSWREFFQGLPPQEPCLLERLSIPIPQVTVQWHPSEARSHTLARSTPLLAWRELIFRLVRFGQRNHLKKGDRIELQNVKVVVLQPQEESSELLQRHGFSLLEFQNYQARILDPLLSPDQPYSYGNRLRGYFSAEENPHQDTLEVAIDRLREDAQSRHVYISLWDTQRDFMTSHKGHPCLVALFLRKFSDCLTLTATFRTHNALDAWLLNLYGLMAIQNHVAKRLGWPCGPITVMSHSISIDPSHFARAQTIANSKQTDDDVDLQSGKVSLRRDPNGEFLVTSDQTTGEIVVRHLYEGQLLKEYRGKRAEQIEAQLARDVALSEISHALYLGRTMAQMEWRLKQGQTSDE
ncbi:MAG: hypothetical protein H7832_00975 [Magnetococcus sp. DMHC-6]